MDKDTHNTHSGVMKLAYSSVEEMKFKAGRRSWIRYRDLGLKDATQGAMSGEIMHIDDATGSKPTGWHYHTSDMQFNYVIEGWVKFEFADVGVITVKEGESILILRQRLKRSRSMRPPAAKKSLLTMVKLSPLEILSEHSRPPRVRIARV